MKNELEKHKAFLAICLIASTMMGAILSGIFLIGTVMNPLTTTSYILTFIAFLLLGILTYYAIINFKIAREQTLITTLITSGIISIGTYVELSFIKNLLRSQSTAISAIADPNIAAAASQQVQEILARISNPTVLIFLITIVIITYNLLPIIFLKDNLKTKSSAHSK